MVKCPECQRIIMDSIGTGGYKVRTRMLLFQEGKAVALCPSCKSPVFVPLCINGEFKVETDKEEPKIVLKT